MTDHDRDETPDDTPVNEPDVRSRLIIGVVVGIVYGLGMRIIFGMDKTSDLLNTLTWSFLTLAPLSIGALTVFFTPAARQVSLLKAFFYPWLACVGFLAIVGVLALEAFICVWMSSPLFFLISGIGGVLMRVILMAANRRTSSYVLTLLLASPFMSSPLEARLTVPDSYRTVANAIVIQASPEVIWQQIIRVPEIQPHERRLTFFQLLGIPQPIQASLDFDGAGGLRHSTYANGMAFNERVLAWQPLDRLHFTIAVDPTAPLPMPFNEVNGVYFAMIDGQYQLEPLPSGEVRLHLSSTHRLSTSFNAYGGLWTDAILYDLQGYILEVIKARAEAA